MKIKCPHCQGVAVIDGARIGDKGFKARCPHCSRRIVIKKKTAVPSGKAAVSPAAAGSESLPPDDGGSPRPTSIRPSQRADSTESEPARLLRRVEQRREARLQEAHQGGAGAGQDQDIEFEDELADVSVEVSLAADPQKMIVSAAVFLVVALGLVLWWSYRLEKGTPPFEPPVDQSLRGAGALYGGSEMEALVRRMRLKTRRDDYRAFSPPLDSPEVLVMAEILKNCNALCPEIGAADLAPLETRDGVFAEMSCNNGNRFNITYYWSTNSAWIDDKQCP